jgi:multiple sugar transport system ATP-binding protein
MNFVEGKIERGNGRARFVARGLTLSLPDAASARQGPVVLGVRPHDIAIDHASDGAIRGVVSLIEPLGSEQLVYVSVPAAGERGHDFVAAVGPESTPRVDESVGLRIAPNAIHLFDPHSGTTLG